jgi:hypothetical protein
MSKFSRNARKYFHILTGQYRVRKLEERLRGLEDRFAVTMTYYEHKIDQLINSVARTLPQENSSSIALPREPKVLEFDRRAEAGEHRSGEHRSGEHRS